VAGNRWGIVGVFAFVAAITVALVYVWQSQLVAPCGAATGAFSATRAFATLSSLLKEQRRIRSDRRKMPSCATASSPN
jgi:hypothetical protein